MDLGLNDARVLIVASDPAVSSETAMRLAAEGADVALACPDAESLRSSIDTSAVNLIDIDASQPDHRAVLQREVPAVDVLIHEGSQHAHKAFADTTEADWLHFYTNNVLTSVALAQSYLPGMLERDRGRFLFVTNAIPLLATGDLLHVAAAKAARISLARGLAMHTRGSNVTVNTVLTGALRSAQFANEVVNFSIHSHAPGSAAEREYMERSVPSALLLRLVEPKEIATLLTYLASSLSAATNGAVLHADGGAATNGL